MDNLPTEGLDVSQELLDLFRDDLEQMAERGLTYRWMTQVMRARAKEVCAFRTSKDSEAVGE